MTSEFIVTRVEPPSAGPVEGQGVASRRYTGGQFEWCWSIPMVFRCLASPQSGQPIAANPRSDAFADNDRLHTGLLGHWNALSYLLTFTLGWSRHDSGLRWWYDAGKPRDGGPLSLIHAVWEADGNLDSYLAWAYVKQPPVRHLLTGTWSAIDPPDELSNEWEARLRPVTDGRPPYGLHLEDAAHLSDASADADGKLGAHPLLRPRLTVTSQSDRCALLEVPSLIGWYRALREFGNELPQPEERSWRVRVYTREIGFLGEYKRSRETGLWFTGRHRFHTPGN